ncbi:MAG: hypothetical protein QM730_04080 [Anaerolineales bacterium]
MAVIHFLKKLFPNAPDRLLGGALMTLLLWLFILPAQFIEIIIKHESFPTSFWDWVLKFFYAWGYVIAMFLIAHLTNFSYASGPLLRFFAEFLGLIIASPIYFSIGASFATQEKRKVVGAVVLAQVHLLISSCITAWLIIFIFGA